MKPEIHPKWYPEAKVICACGNTWNVGSTIPELRTDVCDKCHPFFTGEQRIVDTEGQVDRFMRRLQARQEAIDAAERRRKARTSPELSVRKLGLSSRIEKLLNEAGFEKAGQILERLAEGGDEAFTELSGFGLKSLADMKKQMRARGFVLPGDEEVEVVEEATTEEED
ncbi:MAG: 50S ribosomal protein L31 [Anaerolineae bacterium]|nr:50S ribosomal protein L31 [Anaerolineae bacterium]